MSAELEAYRRCVLDALGRMAEVEEDLMYAADHRNDGTGALVHEHGAMCLREALHAIRDLPRE